MKILSHKRTLVLLALFVFAFAVRFAFISKGPFHYDALDLALASQKTLATGVLHYEHGTGFPLTVIAGSFSIFLLRFFGVTDPVFCVNFMSVVMGAAGVVMFFFLVEKLFGFPTAMFSGILLACFAPHVMISTFGKSLTLGIFLSLASAYYMLRYTAEERNIHLLLSALFLGFCAAARLSDALTAVPISYLYFSSKPLNYRRFKSFVAFGVIASVTAGLYYLPMLLARGLAPFVHVLTSRSQSEFLGPFSFVLQFSLVWLLELLRTDGVLLVTAGFLFMILRRKKRERFFLYFWFLVLHFFYGNVSSTGPRYLVIAWLALLIAQGYFLASFKGRGFLLSSAVVLFIALGDFMRFTPVLEFRHQRSLQAEFAQWVAAKTAPDAVVIAVDEGIFIEHYAKREVLPRPITCDEAQVSRFFEEKIDRLLEEGRDVYLISTGLLAYDSCRVFTRMLPQRYRIFLAGRKLNEEWHHVFLNQFFFYEELYQLKKKT